jgi:non-heme chloroperoxidase
VGLRLQGVLDQFWLWSMQCGLKNAYESIKAFSETDLTEDLKKIRVYPGAPHGLTATHQDQVNADLLAFLRG